MTEDPLYRALGMPRAPAPVRPARRAMWGGLVVVAMLAVGVAAVRLRQGDRTAPAAVAVVPIEVAPAPPPPAPGAAASATPPAAPSNGETIEIQHGVKVIRLGPAASSASVGIPVPDQAAVALAPAPDPRLVQDTRFGPLPRMGADGARPANVYARPAPPVLAGTPRIALVAAGMGLDQTATAQVARRWPPAVTFAVPPDGPDLGAQVAETRAAGHEVILQLPPAAFEAAPAAGQPEGAPSDRLHRWMGRFTGYAGASLPAGGSADLRQAALQEFDARGLYVLDTAAAPAGSASPGLPAVDLVIGSVADKAALDHLVARARARGSAVGWITDPSADLDGMAALTDALARQHVDLVPLSALADGAHGVGQAAK